MAAKLSLMDFTHLTMPHYQENWHHRVLCQRLDDLINGELTRLMVFMPPRAGKSELVSRRLPAYIFGRFPDSQVIACSYSTYLASQMNRDVQRVMDSQPYDLLFDDVHLASRRVDPDERAGYSRTKELFEIVGYGGMYVSLGWDRRRDYRPGV